MLNYLCNAGPRFSAAHVNKSIHFQPSDLWVRTMESSMGRVCDPGDSVCCLTGLFGTPRSQDDDCLLHDGPVETSWGRQYVLSV